MAQANKFQIKNISINEFAIVALKEQLPTGQGFNFDINFAYTINIEQSMVNVLTTVSIFGDDKKKIYSRLQTVCSFQINEPEFADRDEQGGLKINDGLARELNSIALSTTRGILFGQLRGTYLHTALLPVINMNAVQTK